MLRLPVCLVLAFAAAACSKGDSDPSNDLSVDQAQSSANDRFLGHWPSCTFSRRLMFTTPAGTADRAMVNVAGSLDVTDNGDGTIKLTPAAAGITNCILDFTRSGSSAQIVPNQTCDDNGLQLLFGANSDVSVATLALAASFTETFMGMYMGQTASGTGGGVYHCDPR